MTHLALIPLDERPVNTRYPRMIAQIAGAELPLTENTVHFPLNPFEICTLRAALAR